MKNIFLHKSKVNLVNLIDLKDKARYLLHGILKEYVATAKLSSTFHIKDRLLPRS